MKTIFMGILLGFLVVPVYGEGEDRKIDHKKNEDQTLTRKIMKVRQEKARENQEQSFKAKEALEKNRKAESAKK